MNKANPGMPPGSAVGEQPNSALYLIPHELAHMFLLEPLTCLFVVQRTDLKLLVKTHKKPNL